jgi:hypothetical protein
MIYIFEIVIAIGNVVMAWYHSRLIKAEKKINHALWGGMYLMVATLLSWSIHDWWLVVLSLFIRKVLFDLSLNIFRGLPLFYVSTETTSIIDKLHYKIFGKRSEIYQGIYMLVIVILNVLLFNKILC